MHALLIGGDYVDPIKQVLSSEGLDTTDHWTGRKPGDLKKSIPNDTGVVIVLTDYINHGLMNKIRTDSSKRGLPVLFCRRTVQDVREKAHAFAHPHAA